MIAATKPNDRSMAITFNRAVSVMPDLSINTTLGGADIGLITQPKGEIIEPGVACQAKTVLRRDALSFRHGELRYGF